MREMITQRNMKEERPSTRTQIFGRKLYQLTESQIIYQIWKREIDSSISCALA